MWQDSINGTFELLGGFFIMLSCIKLFREKKVRGVSAIHVAYFAGWGFWNIYYYPFLKQWTSFVGGLCVVTVNTLWIFMIIYYNRKEKGEKNKC